jgi:hypothetical protein
MGVEWGIARLKRKWRCFMKRFDSTNSKYTHLFYTIILHTCEAVKDQNIDLSAHN